MSDDDQVGHLFTRREALALLGSAGFMVISGARRSEGSVRTGDRVIANACVVRPEQTEGPYFVDEMLNRSDVRADRNGALKTGAPLALAFNVSRIAGNSCTPLVGALVDIWHCDALGVYSDVRDPSFNTKGERWLRGYQVTDAKGTAQFTTIYPGWYGGRTVHIHFKIRSPQSVSPGYEFTSQLYFDDALTDKVHAQPPYASKGQRGQRNSDDGIFRRDGSQLILAVSPEGKGYRGAFDVSLAGG